jgi:hypothetical protein
MTLQYAPAFGLSVARVQESAGLPVLLFGTVDEPYRTWADLPVDAPQGAIAVDVRSGTAYRAVTAFGRAWWAPAEAWPENEAPTIVAGLDGSEPDLTALESRGWDGGVSEAGEGTVVYQPSGESVVRLRCAGATESTNMGAAGGSASIQTADLTATYDSSTPVWLLLQRDLVEFSGSTARCGVTLTDNARNVRFQRASDVERFLTTGGATVNATSNWWGIITNFRDVPNEEHLELSRSPVSSAGDCYTVKTAGRAYISSSVGLFSSISLWQQFLTVSGGNGSRVVMDIRKALVVVRP